MAKLIRSKRKGIIAALVAVCLVAVFMIAAIAVDGGRILDARRQAKAVTDSAARGAAVEMLDMISGDNTSATISSIRATALRLASDCGFTNDGTNSIVTVNIPPATGAYAGQNGFVEVIIVYKLDRGFSALMGSDSLNAWARSVAGGTYVPSKASILVLDPKAGDALKLSGKGSSLTVDGDIAVNSTQKGGGGLKLDPSTSLTADNIWLASSMEKTDYKKVQGSIHGQLRTQVPPTPDPYQGLPIP
ncbi:MAG TPA: Tad domain-containing protein, partial [Pirellulaceae bacterium]